MDTSHNTKKKFLLQNLVFKSWTFVLL